MSDISEAPKTTEEKIIAEVNEHIKSATSAQEAALQARARAEETESPEEKKKALEEAAQHEKKAEHELKIVKRMQSGAWQGAGIGASVGMGVGTAVGALVGGIAAIPTTGVGLLVGVGAGALHGPWYKVGGAGAGTAEKKSQDEESQDD